MKSNERYIMKEDSKSRPARGAWVEMYLVHLGQVCLQVAPRKGRVG